MRAAPEIPEDEVVEELVAALERAKAPDAGHYIGLLKRTVTERLWAQRQDDGGHAFGSFADFVVHRRRQGLGVSTPQDAKLILHALRENEFVLEVAEFLHKITRGPGRPPETQTNGGSFRPFYPASDSPNSRSAALTRLYRERPDLLRDVKDGKLSVHRAAIAAGIRENPADRMVETLLRGTGKLSPESLLELLRRLAGQMGSAERQAAAEIFQG